MMKINLLAKPSPAVDEEMCPFCGADLLLDGGMDIMRDEMGSRFLDFVGCCEQMRSYAEMGYVDYEGLVEFALDGGRPQRVEAGQNITRGKVHELAESDGLCVYPVEVAVVRGGEAQARVFAFTKTHHGHHSKTPAGWKYGVEARRNDVLIGIAVVGHANARMLDDGTVHEVTRVCCAGDRRLKRDVSSMLYKEAARESKRLGAKKLITYTLEHEAGTACKAIGMADEGVRKGGLRSRAARPRFNEENTGPKRRWGLAL